MEDKSAPKTKYCLRCNYPLSGSFCPECGNTYADKDRRMYTAARPVGSIDVHRDLTE